MKSLLVAANEEQSAHNPSRRGSSQSELRSISFERLPHSPSGADSGSLREPCPYPPRTSTCGSICPFSPFLPPRPSRSANRNAPSRFPVPVGSPSCRCILSLAPPYSDEKSTFLLETALAPFTAPSRWSLEAQRQPIIAMSLGRLSPSSTGATSRSLR
jgi:hypothetical protein